MKKFGLFKKVVHDEDRIDIRRLVNKEAPFAVREAFRTLYTNVLYLPLGNKSKKIAITSAVSGEGKTFVSLNLCMTIAQNSSEQKVLLIDADMRQPRVATLLEDSDVTSHGLSEFLAGIDKEPNIKSTEIENLFVITSGGESVNPGALIRSNRMKELISKCESEFDYVIIDTPPVGIVSDATMLCDFVDGYIISVRSDYSDVKSISDAIDSLHHVGANVLGIVLCNAKYKSGRGNGKYGKYKYSNYGRENSGTKGV